MMCGKQFNHVVRALNVVYEALAALRFSAFFKWCRDNDLMTSFHDKLWSLLSEVVSNFKSGQDNYKTVNETLIVVRTILMPRLEDLIASIIPYMFIANRVSSTWLPVYILDMLNLTSDIQLAFPSGQFAIRQKPVKFNGVWSDMATEKTVIKDSKGRVGIAGIARQKSAFIRWSLIRHVLAEFSVEMRSRSAFFCSRRTLSIM
ncbi:unnamed protein product [Mytilus coruscus]|uniref:Uncharacterized protein n=1 Tax=Mytilus coruscus TaxID=42192 RepID=A0A6J8AC01_MYTCO|nr:unnamed protein product [Mytilus coruscus]